MPIRMEEDEPSNRQENNNSNNQGNGGKGIGNIIFMLLPFLIRRPKLLLLVVAIFGGIYFFKGSGGNGSGNLINSISNITRGCDMDEKVFDQAEVFEPLSPDQALPEKVSLEKYCPSRGDQGQQGSCVGWSTSYAARTILEAVRTGKDPNQLQYSPSFLYNQISLKGCQGAYMLNAMEKLTQVGDLPYSNFGYTDESCDRKPNENELNLAQSHRMKGFNRLTKSGDDYAIDFLAIKQNLAQGAPVTIGMMVGGTFMSDMAGKKVWIPTEEDYSKEGFGGHAMCVIGYDDYLEGGAFQLMNSWSEDWGDRGFAWVRYKDFAYFTKEAYGLYPMAKINDNQTTDFNLKFGLLANDDKQLLSLTKVSDQIFKTIEPIQKGSKFKVEVTNTKECYTYVFGEEVDGAIYTLFPYTAKHSPYCGIVGTRVFPKDYSMKADDVGNKDYIAVLITQSPVDYIKLVSELNKLPKKLNIGERLGQVLKSELMDDVEVNMQEDYINLHAASIHKNATYIVIQIDKK